MKVVKGHKLKKYPKQQRECLRISLVKHILLKKLTLLTLCRVYLEEQDTVSDL